MLYLSLLEGNLSGWFYCRLFDLDGFGWFFIGFLEVVVIFRGRTFFCFLDYDLALDLDCSIYILNFFIDLRIGVCLTFKVIVLWFFGLFAHVLGLFSLVHQADHP